MSHSFISRFTRFPVIHYHSPVRSQYLTNPVLKFDAMIPNYRKNTKNIYGFCWLTYDSESESPVISSCLGCLLCFCWSNPHWLLCWTSKLSGLNFVSCHGPMAPSHLKKSWFFRGLESPECQGVKAFLREIYGNIMEISIFIYIYSW